MLIWGHHTNYTFGILITPSPRPQARNPAGDMGFVCPVGPAEAGFQTFFFDERKVESIDEEEEGGQEGKGNGAEQQCFRDEDELAAGDHGVARVAVRAADDQTFRGLPGCRRAFADCREEADRPGHQP